MPLYYATRFHSSNYLYPESSHPLFSGYDDHWCVSHSLLPLWGRALNEIHTTVFRRTSNALVESYMMYHSDIHKNLLSSDRNRLFWLPVREFFPDRDYFENLDMPLQNFSLHTAMYYSLLEYCQSLLLLCLGTLTPNILSIALGCCCRRFGCFYHDLHCHG